MNRLLTSILIGSAMLGAQLATENSAFAASSCNGAGWLCVYDSETGQYGNFSANNSSWAPYGWDNRADWARNDGNYQNVCLYYNVNYGGSSYFIPRNGQWYDIPDNVFSSNKWTYNSYCP